MTIIVKGQRVTDGKRPDGKPLPKARPRRLPRAWNKDHTRAVRSRRCALVKLAGSHRRWSHAEATMYGARLIAARCEELGVVIGVPRSLRGSRG